MFCEFSVPLVFGPDANSNRPLFQPIRPDSIGFFEAGVIVDDFDKTLATLKARGLSIAMAPFPASETQRANVIIRDNAGNLIQFFGPSFSRAR